MRGPGHCTGRFCAAGEELAVVHFSTLPRVGAAALDPATASDLENYTLTRWNYKWTGARGSDNDSITDPTQHSKALTDTVTIEKIALSPGHKTLTLTRADMQPAMTLRLKFNIPSADGKPVDQDNHSTIHQLPAGGGK